MLMVLLSKCSLMQGPSGSRLRAIITKKKTTSINIRAALVLFAAVLTNTILCISSVVLGASFFTRFFWRCIWNEARIVMWTKKRNFVISWDSISTWKYSFYKSWELWVTLVDIFHGKPLHKVCMQDLLVTYYCIVITIHLHWTI